MNRLFPILLVCPYCWLISGISLVVVVDACAETVEPMPSYADTRALRQDASLHAVAFAGSDSDKEPVGIACGDRGAILRSEDGGRTWVACESGVECRLRDVVWIGPRRVVVAGGGYDRITRISRGVALYSDDAGRSWRAAADNELPRFRSLRAQQDGSILATTDWSHSLLTHQMASHDGGRTWRAAGDGQLRATPARPSTSSDMSHWAEAMRLTVAVRDACRINASALCAVGDHGVILRSGDRGKSWQAVRGEGRHTSILFIAKDPAAVAWSLLGHEALENRNRVALLLQDAGQWGESDNVSPIELAAQVAVMLGASGADTITVDGSGMERAAAEWIRIHRPAAIVMDKSLPSRIHQAFFQAATSAGVSRVVTYAFNGVGNIALHRDALLPKAGALASDLNADALHYVAPHRQEAPSVSLRYLYDVAPRALRGDTVVGGVPLEKAQSLAAPASPVSRRQLQIVQARLKQAKRLAGLVGSSRSVGPFSETLRSALDQTAKEDQFRLAWSILLDAQTSAHQNNAQGIELTRIVLDQIAERFPANSAGRWAALRSESIRHSLEWQRLRLTLADSATHAQGSPSAETVSVSPFQTSPSGVRQASAVSPLVVPKPQTHQLNPQREGTAEVDLTWEFHPLVLISREAARSRGDDGQLQISGGQSANMKRLAQVDSPWSALLGVAGPQVIIARRADMQPKLDGILDDGCWQSALSSAGRSTRLRVAYDDEYVYVATQCHARQLAADLPSSAAQTGPATVRDHDLSDVDRMQLLFDVDRDLVTTLQLQVTDAGRTHDAIDGNPAWQPTWYVDTRRSDDLVTIEIAILRRDLVDLPITAGESWYLSARPLPSGSRPGVTIVPDPSRWTRVLFR